MKPDEMKYDKYHYMSIPTYNGFSWGYFESGLHHFVKGDYQSSFKDVAVRESDIEDGSWEFMIDKGVLRIF